MKIQARLGITSYAYDWAITCPKAGESPLSSFGLLEKAARHNLHAVQICDNLPLGQLDPSELTSLKQRARNLGISLELGMRGLDPEGLREGFELACRLEARLMRVVPWSGAEIQQPMTGEQVLHALAPLLPGCRKENITLAVENYFELPDQELASILRQAADPYLGACLDTANSTGLLVNPLDTVRTLAPYVVSVHLKDFSIRKPRQGYCIIGAPLGKGQLDARTVLDMVDKSNRNAHVLIELWLDGEIQPGEVLAQEELWVAQSVEYAQKELGLL